MGREHREQRDEQDGDRGPGEEPAGEVESPTGGGLHPVEARHQKDSPMPKCTLQTGGSRHWSFQ